MAFTVYIAIPEGVIHATYLALMFLVAVGSWQIRGVAKDREWNADVSRRSRSTLRMAHVAEAPADVIYRPDPEIAIFRACPWRRPEEEALAA